MLGRFRTRHLFECSDGVPPQQMVEASCLELLYASELNDVRQPERVSLRTTHAIRCLQRIEVFR